MIRGPRFSQSPARPQELDPATESGLKMLVPQTAWRILCHRTGGTISRATFYRWVSDGKIPSIRLGAQIFIPWPAVDELIRKCYAPD